MALLRSPKSSLLPAHQRRAPRTAAGLLLVVGLLGLLAACTPDSSKPKPPKPPNTRGSTTTTSPPPTTMPPTTMPTTTMPTTTMPPTTMPPSMGGQDQCAFGTFCDNFAQPSPGGRGGDLDESKWSFSRLSQETNPSQGTVNKFAPVNAEFCVTHQVRLADNDSFVCGQQFGESNHWMEAIYDNGSYVDDSARITQPFDFAGRTGTFDFSVDAKSTGSHGSWVETWLTDQPVNSPHRDAAGTHAFPRNGIAVIFDQPETCPGGIGPMQANSVREIDVFTNYMQRTYTVAPNCFTTQDDRANHVQVKVSTTGAEVWVSDHANDMMQTPALQKRVSVAFDAPLSWSHGYWNLEHAQYNASKAIEPCNCGPNSFTYHWHAVSFDGPVVANDRTYQVPDALNANCNGNNAVCGVNLGYTPGCWGAVVACTNWTIPNVDKTGATAAYLTYDVNYGCCNGHALNVTVNGHTYLVSDPNPDVGSTQLDAWRYAVVPVPLSDLQAGSNPVSMSSPQCNGSCPSVANVDLEMVRS